MMTSEHPTPTELKRRHPLFFWGALTVVVLLFSATVVMGSRIPQYRQEAASIDEAMTEAERLTRDSILSSEARRSELAMALLQRELRLKTMEENQVHLALSTEDSVLALRHGQATLREVRVHVGGDSTVRAPDGRSWRQVQALGERHLVEKEVDAAVPVPEWVYVGRGEAVPPEEERTRAGSFGRYLLRLDDGTLIYTRPRSGPLAEDRAQPGTFMVEDEGAMRAIFDALRRDTPVYIY